MVVCGTMTLGAGWLDARLDQGDVVIVDGATGSELEARGVPMVEKRLGSHGPA